MLAVMKISIPLSRWRFDVYANDHPMFCDVMDSSPGELERRDAFLSAWRDALSPAVSDRAAMLLLEAEFLLKGIEAVASRVRSWGGEQPRGWLFWIRLLVSANDWRGVADAAEEALSKVEHSNFRALVAGDLAEAGEKIRRPVLVLKGRREKFFSAPDDAHLLQLIEEADRQSLHIEAAFAAAGKTRALGWSYGGSGGAVLFASILVYLCLNRLDLAVTVRRVLKRYADSDFGSYEFSGADEEAPEDQVATRSAVSDEIIRGLHSVTVSPKEKQDYLLWAVKIGRKRIEAIVSNKHRKAYERAAEVLASLAECYVLIGEPIAGHGIIDEYRNQKFNRHSAFCAELDAIIASSALLRRWPR